MRRISAALIAKIAAAAESEGLDRCALLEVTGVDVDGPVDPSHMVSEEAHYLLWEHIMRRIAQADGFPVRYARTIHVDDYGALGLAFKTAPNVRAVIERARRYSAVLTDTSWIESTETDKGVTIAFRREGRRRLGMRCANEAAVAEIVHVTRQITASSISPERVLFRHGAPANTDEHEAFFGCEVSFGREMDGMQFGRVMDLPVVLADDGLSRFLIAHLDEALDRTVPALEARIKRVVGNQLPSGVPKVEDIARGVGMSSRTLRRRLAERGLRYQDLVDETRKELAARMLTERWHSLGEIAFLLGFSEPSAFSRAFRRWTGRSPAQFRLDLVR